MTKVIDGALSTDCAGNKFILTFERLECVNFETIMCVCSNANLLHYYVLRVPRKVDRWR